MISRRNFVRSLLCSGLAGGWSAAGAALRHRDAPAQEGQLPGALFSDREAVAKVARSYLDAHPAEAQTVHLLSSLQIPDVVENAGSQRRHLGRLRERDFETGDVLFVDGWMISRTEARLCVLASRWM